ncbi:MAG TPA: hypothetical protein VIY49_10360 [Bryobacteraceae bacterium]
MIFLTSVALLAQDKASSTPMQITVSAGHFYTEQAPVLTRDDLTITEGFEEVPIVSVTPLHGAIEIFLLIDHCSSCEPGTKFNELRRFIVAQPPETSFGVAYIRGGRLEQALNPTQDREAVVKAINTPEGSKPANPFTALAELIRQWPPSTSRRAVLMISNGLDPAGEIDKANSPAEDAIDEAIRAGVSVFAMYHPSADYATADWSKVYAGQVELAHVAAETGGEAYFLGFGPLPTIAPFLDDVADHLANQYVLAFVPRATSPGSFENIDVMSTNLKFDLTAPAKIWIAPVESATGQP